MRASNSRWYNRLITTRSETYSASCSYISYEQRKENTGRTYHFLDHVHDFLFDQVQALSIACRSTANNIVDLDVIIILAHTTAVHGIGKFDKDRVLLHDPLNMLTANTDDSLVVLIGDVEGNRSRHLLLDKIKTALGGLKLVSANINVEVVLVEAIEDNLNVAYLPLMVFIKTISSLVTDFDP